MSEQLCIEDAIAARDEAIDRVEKNAQAEWLDAAYRAVKSLAANRDEFTTDDVWVLLTEWGHSVREPRALGAVMRKAAKDDLIQASGRYEKSERKVCHRNPKMVWLSLAIEADDPFMTWDGESEVPFF
jgi:hypothetical protein